LSPENWGHIGYCATSIAWSVVHNSIVWQTDGRTDGRTDRIALCVSHSVLCEFKDNSIKLTAPRLSHSGQFSIFGTSCSPKRMCT